MDHEFREVADAVVVETSEGFEAAGDEPDSSRPSAAAPSPALALARAAAAKRAADEEVHPKGRAWGHDALMLVRRSHLYAGLLLYPWVLLYGATAFLFNHPLVFSDQTIIPIGREAMEGTGLEKLPTPADLAAKVVAALNERSEGTTYTLVKPEAARFERGGLGASVVADGGKSYTVTLDRDGGTARLVPAGAAAPGAGGEGGAAGERGGARRARGEGAEAPRGEGGMRRGRGEGGPEGEGGGRRPRGEGGLEGEAAGRRGREEGGPAGERGGMRRGRGGEGEGEGMGMGPGEGEEGPRRGPGGGLPAPFATASGLTIEEPALEALREGLPTALARAGLTDPKVSEVRVAPLSFQVEGDGRPWLATYNLQTGAISGRPLDAPGAQAELTTRRFLLRLHTLHGYPSEFGVRWIWSLLVDVMAVLMVFWGVSGIVMWWQIKRLRRVGAVALAFSTAAAVWIGVGMHYYLIQGGR